MTTFEFCVIRPITALAQAVVLLWSITNPSSNLTAINLVGRGFGLLKLKTRRLVTPT